MNVYDAGIHCRVRGLANDRRLEHRSQQLAHFHGGGSRSGNGAAPPVPGQIRAVIVDCDVAGGKDLLASLRNSDAAKTIVPMAITAGQVSLPELSGWGTRFVFAKPVSLEQAVRTLSAARNLMLHGRLRYFRQPLENPVVHHVFRSPARGCHAHQSQPWRRRYSQPEAAHR